MIDIALFYGDKNCNKSKLRNVLGIYKITNIENNKCYIRKHKRFITKILYSL